MNTIVMDVEAIKAELDAECAAIIAAYDAIDEQVGQRYFSDPIAWDAVQSLELEVYEAFMGYCRYSLSSELTGQESMPRKEFEKLPLVTKNLLVERAFVQ